MKKPTDIRFYHLGNGYTVCDLSLPEENKDYAKVAHINKYREIAWYKEVSKLTKTLVENFAKTNDGSVSASQIDEKVFVARPIIDGNKSKK